MEHVKYKADLSEWELNAADDLRQIGLKVAADALQFVFESDETYMYFPIEWNFVYEDIKGDRASDGIGGQPVTDPMIMFLRVGMESDGEKPTFKFCLRNVVDRYIANLKSGDGVVQGDHLESVVALRDGFRELAGKMDELC